MGLECVGEGGVEDLEGGKSSLKREREEKLRRRERNSDSFANVKEKKTHLHHSSAISLLPPSASPRIHNPLQKFQINCIDFPGSW